MKNLAKIGLVFLLGAAIGAAYDSAAWNYHLQYVGFNWLGPLIGADGEKGYDAMLYESMIDFGVALVLILTCLRFLIRKFSSKPWQSTP